MGGYFIQTYFCKIAAYLVEDFLYIAAKGTCGQTFCADFAVSRGVSCTVRDYARFGGMHLSGGIRIDGLLDILFVGTRR